MLVLLIVIVIDLFSIRSTSTIMSTKMVADPGAITLFVIFLAR